MTTTILDGRLLREGIEGECVQLITDFFEQNNDLLADWPKDVQRRWEQINALVELIVELVVKMMNYRQTTGKGQMVSIFSQLLASRDPYNIHIEKIYMTHGDLTHVWTRAAEIVDARYPQGTAFASYVFNDFLRGLMQRTAPLTDSQSESYNLKTKELPPTS